jgi:hypothetical protein
MKDKYINCKQMRGNIAREVKGHKNESLKNGQNLKRKEGDCNVSVDFKGK